MKVQHLKLEVCEVADIEKVVEVLNSTEIGERYFDNDVDRIRNVIEKQQEKSQISVVRNDEDKIVGTLVYDDQGAFDKYPYIHMLAVASEFQGNGVGTIMLDLFEKERKANKYFLFVAEWNERAKKLYERLGYKELGRIDGFYTKGQVEVLMMKST